MPFAKYASKVLAKYLVSHSGSFSRQCCIGKAEFQSVEYYLISGQGSLRALKRISNLPPKVSEATLTNAHVDNVQISTVQKLLLPALQAQRLLFKKNRTLLYVVSCARNLLVPVAVRSFFLTTSFPFACDLFLCRLTDFPTLESALSALAFSKGRSGLSILPTLTSQQGKLPGGVVGSTFLW